MAVIVRVSPLSMMLVPAGVVVPPFRELTLRVKVGALGTARHSPVAMTSIEPNVTQRLLRYGRRLFTWSVASLDRISLGVVHSGTTMLLSSCVAVAA